jgi:hypothetical protein
MRDGSIACPSRGMSYRVVAYGSRAALPTGLAARPVYPRYLTTYRTARGRQRRANNRNPAKLSSLLFSRWIHEWIS